MVVCIVVRGVGGVGDDDADIWDFEGMHCDAQESRARVRNLIMELLEIRSVAKGLR